MGGGAYPLSGDGLFEERFEFWLRGRLGEGDAVPPKLRGKESPAEELSRVACGSVPHEFGLPLVRMKHQLQLGTLVAREAAEGDDTILDGKALAFDDGLLRWWRRGCRHRRVGWCDCVAWCGIC